MRLNLYILVILLFSAADWYTLKLLRRRSIYCPLSRMCRSSDVYGIHQRVAWSYAKRTKWCSYKNDIEIKTNIVFVIQVRNNDKNNNNRNVSAIKPSIHNKSRFGIKSDAIANSSINRIVVRSCSVPWACDAQYYKDIVHTQNKNWLKINIQSNLCIWATNVFIGSIYALNKANKITPRVQKAFQRARYGGCPRGHQQKSKNTPTC